MSGSNLLFILSGSIACAKACDAISLLVQAGHRVRVVATVPALRFVGATTLEGLTGSAVLSDMFAPGTALEHIELTRWADAVVLCPATANTINRLAAGLADDLAGALFLAHDRTKPWLVVPAMNPAMWAHPATQSSARRLSEWGVRVLPVASGRTACGEEGEGRMIEPGRIALEVERAVARPARRLRVLITSGGTVEPIDRVRVLGNTSTGATGAGLARHFARCGHDVLLLRARTAVPTADGLREETFGTFEELDAALTRILAGEEFDAVIHAAAVGDFSIAAVEIGGVAPVAGAAKIPSDAAPVLRLRPNPKLLDTLRARSRNPRVALVAFKLTHGAAPADAAAAVAPLFARAGVDFVVHNDLAVRIDAEDFPASVWRRDAAGPVPCPTRHALAATLERLLAAGPGAGAGST